MAMASGPVRLRCGNGGDFRFTDASRAMGNPVFVHRPAPDPALRMVAAEQATTCKGSAAADYLKS